PPPAAPARTRRTPQPGEGRASISPLSSPARPAAGEACLRAQLQDALFGLAQLLAVKLEVGLRAGLVAEARTGEAELIVAFRRIGIGRHDFHERIAGVGVPLLLHEE